MIKQSNKTMLLHKKMIKMFSIIKKKQFSRTNVFISSRSISFNKQAFFDVRSECNVSICQDSKLLKRRDITAI